MTKQRGSARQRVRLSLIVAGAVLLSAASGWIVWRNQISADSLNSLEPIFNDVFDNTNNGTGGTSASTTQNQSAPATTAASTSDTGCVDDTGKSVPCPEVLIQPNGGSGSSTDSTGATSGSNPGGTAGNGKITVKPVSAADTGTFFSGVGGGVGGNIAKYIQQIYAWALVIGAGLAVIMIMYSGYVYITSAGDPEGIRSAKDYLVGALIGLATLILTATIAKTLVIPSSNLGSNQAANSTTNKPILGAGIDGSSVLPTADYAKLTDIQKASVTGLGFQSTGVKTVTTDAKGNATVTFFNGQTAEISSTGTVTKKP